MKIIPVMDILNGVVVHAVKGKRKHYQPLTSILVASTDPLAVASAFRSCGFGELYVADLDSILGKDENFRVLRQITEKTGLSLLVDAGIGNLETVQELFRNNVSKIIVGTETLPNLNLLREIINCFGSEKIVVSLDLKNGKVLSKSKSVVSKSPLELAHEFEKIGIAELIVLDLARVGSGEGVDFGLLKEILGTAIAKVLLGGGVRDIKDLLSLKELGVYGVLLSTALHSGRISIQDLRLANLI